MCVYCEAVKIRNNDGLTAGVKIARLFDLISGLMAAIGEFQDVCIAANALGMNHLPFDSTAFDNLFRNLDDEQMRIADKILDGEVPALDPDVLAKFHKGA